MYEGGVGGYSNAPQNWYIISLQESSYWGLFQFVRLETSLDKYTAHDKNSIWENVFGHALWNVVRVSIALTN